MGDLGDGGAGGDGTQDGFEKGYGKGPAWWKDAPAEAWVHRIAINTAISYQRYSRMREVGQVIKRLGRPTLPLDPGSVAERSDLFNALRKLPPKQAAAIVLRHHHGYTNREIAAALEIPERTVASRLIAAKARLRQILDSEPRKGPGIDMSTLSEDSVPLD